LECKGQRKGETTGKVGTTAFDWLHVWGPFPVKDGETLFLPNPADLAVVDGRAWEYFRLIPRAEGKDNLRHDFLERLPASFSKPSKEPLRAWLPAPTLALYLRGEAVRHEECRLWSSEHRIGVTIKAETHTAENRGLYGVEHLRLQDDVALRFSVSDPPAHKPTDPREADLTVEALVGQVLQLGGEQRFGEVRLAPHELTLPQVTPTDTRLKWVLLTPAIFSDGWLPGWIDKETGAVRLRVINKEDRRDFRRQRRHAGWRYDEDADAADRIDARLIAACVNKPRVISGWDILHDKNGGARPTYLAVPAGSVFYFEARSETEAKKLQLALQGRCRSDFFGEKGLGLGVCGLWNHQVAGDFN
jgi:CRISPR type III-B/RAMP module-associated protein Cmr3